MVERLEWSWRWPVTWVALACLLTSEWTPAAPVYEVLWDHTRGRRNGLPVLRVVVAIVDGVCGEEKDGNA